MPCTCHPAYLTYMQSTSCEMPGRMKHKLESGLTEEKLTTSDIQMTPHLSVQFSHSVLSNSLQPHELQQNRPSYPSPTPRVYPNSCPLSQWCHPTISSSVIPFSSCLQSFPASWSFPMSQVFTSSSQNNEVSASASVFPMNIQDWFPLGLTGLISLKSKELSRVSLTSQFKSTNSLALSFLSSPNSHIHT